MRNLHEMDGFVCNLVKLGMVYYGLSFGGPHKGNHLWLDSSWMKRSSPGTWVIESENEHALVYCTDVGALTTRGQLVRMVLFPTSVHFKYVDQLPVVSQLKLT